MKRCAFVIVWIGLLAPAAAAQLATDWAIPAVAHTEGRRGTFWRSDVSLHNPHSFDLPVVVQLLPSTSENWEAPTLTLTLYPYETVNLWDALGPDVFDFVGTGAMLAYADTSLACDPIETCQFMVTSRTYTVDPWGGIGEFGQAIPGVDVWHGVDWEHYGYAAGILSDGTAFRCNVGVASWTPGWTTVRVDVQHADGTILATHQIDVPPYGHVQQRLSTEVVGGSLVFYLVDGPDEALVFPYASVVDQDTGDPSFVACNSSVVGLEVAKVEGVPRPLRPAHPRQRDAGVAEIRRLTR
jgi:hypothetical protein